VGRGKLSDVSCAMGSLVVIVSFMSAIMYGTPLGLVGHSDFGSVLSYTLQPNWARYRSRPNLLTDNHHDPLTDSGATQRRADHVLKAPLSHLSALHSKQQQGRL